MSPLTFNPAFSARFSQRQQTAAPASSARQPQAAPPRFGSAPEISNALLTLAGTGALGIGGWALFDTVGSGSFTEKGKGKALMKAIKNGNNKRAERLLARGVNPSSVLLRSSFVVGNDYGYPFLEALRQKNFDLAGKMIDQYDISLSGSNYKNIGSVSMGSTSMMDEALHMGPEALSFLLEKGLDPNQTSEMSWNYGKTAIETIALGYKYENDRTVECLKVLLDHGTNDDLAKIIERMQNEMEFGNSEPDVIKKFRQDPEGGYSFVKQYLPEFTKPRAFALLEEYAARQGK